MAMRCSGAAAVTSLQEHGVICGCDRGQVWLSTGRGEEISYLEHLFWVTEAMGSGDLQREEGRAAAGWLSTPSIILQIIYLTLCKLTLPSDKVPGAKSLLPLPEHARTSGLRQQCYTVCQQGESLASKEQEKSKPILNPP